MSASGKLIRNECERFKIDDYQLTSGSVVEIRINNNWLLGIIEHWRDAYYWFSKDEGIAVILRNGISARIPKRT